MTHSFKAIYENGVLRPLRPLEGVPERARVDVTLIAPDIATHDARSCVGTLPDADAAEMARLIRDEFEKVDERDW